MTDKKILRKQCRENRNSLSEEQRQAFSKQICEKLIPLLKDKKVLSYAPFKSEVDVSLINESLPVCYPLIREAGMMDAFFPVENRFVPNKLGILEPDPDHSEKISKNELDVILVPCLGFTKQKDRLGQGGGYYDRYLKDCNALKIGIAFEVQKIEEDISEAHDIPLDMIITEKNTY